ncbi:alcohol dehydrogenase catalytic domain-containing protein [Actinoplanes sp. NPDC051411]|uniref:alcohol dehydrogenase catalytic domain-containing protein n=1 Tax=Actinoplanes sp. NPDC051411 TaxID=3155522 RepID=UPI003426C4C4
MSRLILPAVGDEAVLEENYELPLGPGDVRVAVDAAPVNPADHLFMQGWFGVYPQVPAPLGGEGAGRVVAAGASADQSLIGQQVIILPTFTHGSWADEVVVPASGVIPVSGDPQQLALLSVNPATAYALLNDYVTLSPGDWIGVSLANSAVGRAVIALARRSGLKVLAFVRSEEAAASVTADAVVVGDGDVLAALGPARLSVFFDGGAPDLSAVVPAVADGGTIVTFSSTTGQSPVVPFGDFLYRGISLRSFYILRWLATTPRERLVSVYTSLAELLADGTLGTPVAATYPLSAYREALAHTGGKVLFTP